MEEIDQGEKEDNDDTEGSEDHEKKEEYDGDFNKLQEDSVAYKKRLDYLWSTIVEILDREINAEQEVCQLKLEVPVLINVLVEASNWERLDHVVCKFCDAYQPFYMIYNWTGKHREHLKVMACEQLKYYKNIMSCGGISLFTSTHAIIPMHLLLLSLKPQGKRRAPAEVELLYVTILYHISKRIQNGKLLDTLSHDLYTKEGFKIDRFTFFELLIGYTHQSGDLGNIARDGILYCVKASISHKEFSHYITHESSGCNIIAAGLSGRYSSLPNMLELRGDDWHCLTECDIKNLKELQEFLNTLNFCCAITEAGNKAVTSKLLSLIHEGFLTPVLAPLLNQSSVESQIAITAYLELFIRSITDPKVMKIFLKFILTDKYDNASLLHILIAHINSENSYLSSVALQFFKTLLELNCEDVLYSLVLRYLVGCYHVVPNQKRTIKEVDFYCRSATMFLYLTPQCCIETNKNIVENSVDDTSSLDSSLSQKCMVSTTPELRRKISGSSTISKCSSGSNPELPFTQALQFMSYLHTVKRTIVSCKKACSCWSAVYDGMDVSADDANVEDAGTAANSFIEALRNGGISKIGSPKMKRIDFSLGNDDSRCLGPFMNSVFDKIESMLDNNLYVNLMLTSLVSRLACYSQPLLRSFLLNSNLVIKPGVRSLVQVITHVSSIANDIVCQLDDFKILIKNARQFLCNRELPDILNGPRLNNNDGDSSFTVELDYRTGASKFERYNVYDRDEKDSLDDTISAEIFQHQKNKSLNTSEITRNSNPLETNVIFNSPPGNAGRLHPVLPKLSSRSPKRSRNKLSKNEIAELRKKNPDYIRNAICCVIILEEFMKELAAISIEQTLL